MSAPTKPTMADVSEMVLDYLSHPDNGVGGNLHVVLDDGNTDDGSINFCYGYASANKDKAGVRLACAMLQITEAERDALYANRWQVTALPPPEGDVGDRRVLTPDDLRTIVERHAEDCACSYGLGHAHEDRGALLDLLRRVAKIRLIDGGGFCPLCDAYVSTGRHDKPDCPAPLLEALRVASV